MTGRDFSQSSRDLIEGLRSRLLEHVPDLYSPPRWTDVRFGRGCSIASLMLPCLLAIRFAPKAKHGTAKHTMHEHGEVCCRVMTCCAFLRMQTSLLSHSLILCLRLLAHLALTVFCRVRRYLFAQIHTDCSQLQTLSLMNARSSLSLHILL